MGFLGALFGKRFATHKERGDRYFQEGQFGLARAEYEAALKRFDPARDDAAARRAVTDGLQQARERIGLAQLEEGERLLAAELPNEALDALQLALELLPAGHERRAAAETARHRAETRRQTAELDGPKAVLGLDSAAAGADDADADADADFDDDFERYLLPLSDEQAEAYRDLGADFRAGCGALQQGDGTGAVAAFTKAKALAPDNPYVALELGKALLFAGEAAAAGVELARYSDAYPDDPDVAYLLADAWRSADRAADALALLEAEAERRPHSVRARLAIADHHLAAGAPAAAVEAAEAALALVDLETPPRRHSTWSRGASAAGTLDAMAARANSRERIPPRLVLLRTLGQALIAADRAAEALEPLDQAIRAHWRYDPENRQFDFDRDAVWLFARVAIDTKRRLARAVELLHVLAVSVSPEEQPAVWATLGRAYALQGEPREARAHLERAQAALPTERADERARVAQWLAELD